MGVFRTSFSMETREEGDLIDLTEKVRETVKASGLGSGIACAFVPHTTASIFITEDEPGLRVDIKRVLERVFPKGFGYAHNMNGDDNGHSHVRAALLGQSVSVPFDSSELDLGTWQRIMLMELDNRGRSRKIVIQLTGE